MKAGLELIVDLKNWKESAKSGTNLSELYLTLGDVVSAQKYGEQSVTFADRTEEDFERNYTRARLADISNQSGKKVTAKKLFLEAEEIQKKSGGDYLNSLSGFQFCDLLLSMGKYQEVLERAQTTVKYENEGWYPLLSFALDKLTIGKAYMLLGDSTESEKYLNQAVVILREANRQDYLPRGLLARATLYRHKREFLKFWTDLDEAREIAEYGQMRLHLTDYHLEAARLIKAQIANDNTKKEYKIIDDGIEEKYSKEKMKKLFNEHVAKAEKLIEETGYHRRDKELKELKK